MLQSAATALVAQATASSNTGLPAGVTVSSAVVVSGGGGGGSSALKLSAGAGVGVAVGALLTLAALGFAFFLHVRHAAARVVRSRVSGPLCACSGGARRRRPLDPRRYVRARVVARLR